MASNSNILIAVAATSVISIAGCMLIQHLSEKKQKHKFRRQRSLNSKLPSKAYEDRQILNQYILFHYAEDQDFLMFDHKEYPGIVSHLQFPKRIAHLCREHCPDLFSENRGSGDDRRVALDIGCGLGRSTFELSKLFDYVTGIDYSQSFIEHCQQLLTGKSIEYECMIEGDINQKLVASLDEDVKISRVNFEVGDACDLREDMGKFDFVLASNLICRVTEPLKFLARLKDIVKYNGYVILSTPFNWQTEHTAEENWIGGYLDLEGNAIYGIDGLKNNMADSFNLISQFDMPMVLRNTQRRFEFTICLITVWQRR